MKKIHILSVLCLIFFACDTEVNNSNNETSDLSSSSKRTISSSSEGGSSSSVVHNCKPFLSKSAYISKDTLYFNKQGGIDTAAISYSNIRFEDFEIFGQYKHDYKYLNQCALFQTNKDNDFERLNSDSQRGVPITKIECSWFSLAYISKDSVQVLVSKNETGKERSAYIPLTNTGGCALGVVGNIIITQTSVP